MYNIIYIRLEKNRENQNKTGERRKSVALLFSSRVLVRFSTSSLEKSLNKLKTN
jgi:hypothetical protein